MTIHAFIMTSRNDILICDPIATGYHRLPHQPAHTRAKDKTRCQLSQSLSSSST